MADRKRPFRFGVNLRGARSRSEWREKARRAEALGFDTVLVPDHLSDLLPPFPALMAAAEATASVRVGTFVLNNDFRHPAFVAREAAAVDLLSDGRLELGLGAGHMESEYGEVGLGYDPASVRVERLGESVRIIKRLLVGEEVTFHGSHYDLAGHCAYPRPVQRPRPPLLIGGNGRQLLTLAAQEADIVGFTGFSPRRGGTASDFSAFGSEGAAGRIALVRRVAGARFEELELNALVQVVEVTKSPRRAAEEGVRGSELTADAVLDSPFALLGSRQAMANALCGWRERLGLSYFVVFEPAMDAFAGVISRLAGT
ncbi:MAG TPA: TIGR03621 family F420-dependent LLM class oxidoreductase [Gaiellaceae bacterium]|nr:TIGR03621 family F420-dependent LLM class oxidoreductase [Gaiellaceae bacterium]